MYVVAESEDAEMWSAPVICLASPCRDLVCSTPEAVIYAHDKHICGCGQIQNAHVLGSTAQSVICVGDSAGGNLAAVVALRAVEEGIQVYLSACVLAV